MVGEGRGRSRGKPVVLGLGQASFDLLGRLSDYPQVDQKAELSELLLQGGGPVATALVTLARLGVVTAMAGRVGDDDFGEKIRSGLVVEGVDCGALLVDPGATSQVAFVAVDDDGRRTLFWTRGSARHLQASEFDPHLLDGCRVLHLDGLHAEISLHAARLARSRGVVTVLDGGTFRPGTEPLLPWIDHLVVSERFGGHFGSLHDPASILRALLSYGGSAATLTLGAGGCYTQARGGEVFHQKAFPVAAVDTTGCGDVFHGGYIYGLLEGWSLARTVRFAAACAALKARALGGRTAIPVLPEVTAFLATHVDTQIQSGS